MITSGPCASFDLTDPEQQRQCFHYTNLQPLWAADNIRKSDPGCLNWINRVTVDDGLVRLYVEPSESDLPSTYQMPINRSSTLFPRMLSAFAGI